jgi:hypothetical protein
LVITDLGVFTVDRQGGMTLIELAGSSPVSRNTATVALFLRSSVSTLVLALVSSLALVVYVAFLQRRAPR